MGKASDWLREERRKVLGDWVAFCLDCGGALRWFEEWDPEANDAPRHAAGLAPLLDAIVHVCRTAKEHHAAVVYTWKM